MWLESVYLVQQDGGLKIRFLQSDNISCEITHLPESLLEVNHPLSGQGAPLATAHQVGIRLVSVTGLDSVRSDTRLHHKTLRPEL